MGHSLARLAATINWRLLEERFGAVYSDKPGRPALPTGLMVGLSILKHTHNLSDEELRAPGREPAFDSLENRRFDCRYLANDLFEALSILTLQQRKRQSDERFVTARVVGEPSRRAGGRRDGLSTHRRRWCRSSSFPRICLSFGALPRVSVQAKGKDEGELGALEAGQAANLAGLAPIARQSGRWTGRSFIRGGRADVRQALYMPALVAARFNPDMKAKYAHLIETENPAKVAITAIMRKLVVLANALLKANRPWTPKTA